MNLTRRQVLTGTLGTVTALSGCVSGDTEYECTDNQVVYKNMTTGWEINLNRSDPYERRDNIKWAQNLETELKREGYSAEVILEDEVRHGKRRELEIWAPFNRKELETRLHDAEIMFEEDAIKEISRGGGFIDEGGNLNNPLNGGILEQRISFLRDHSDVLPFKTDDINYAKGGYVEFGNHIQKSTRELMLQSLRQRGHVNFEIGDDTMGRAKNLTSVSEDRVIGKSVTLTPTNPKSMKLVHEPTGVEDPVTLKVTLSSEGKLRYRSLLRLHTREEPPYELTVTRGPDGKPPDHNSTGEVVYRRDLNEKEQETVKELNQDASSEIGFEEVTLPGLSPDLAVLLGVGLRKFSSTTIGFSEYC